jgi:dolichol-phosphate mannosyltransferase
MISVVLPTFNESLNIHELLREIRLALGGQDEWEILVVDDASPDGTAAAVAEAGRDDSRIRLLARSERGLAGAVRHGCERAIGDVIVVMDSDFNHRPEHIPELLAALPACDLVVGSRYVAGGGMPRSRLRFALSGLYNVAVRSILALPTRDNLSGFLAFRPSLLGVLPADDVFVGYGDYAIRLIQAVHRAGGRIAEVPAVYGTRPYGESKTRFLYHLMTYTRTVLELRRRPVEPLGRCESASS